MRSLSFLVLALAVLAHAVPYPATHVMHEKRHEHSSRRWLKGGRVDASAVLPLRIGLTQRNLDKGHDLLMSVSHPDSANYGKHWTADEVVEMFAPADETVEAVKHWLFQAGIPDYRITHSDNKAWLAFDATAEEAEKLLLTEYHSFEHYSTGDLAVGCEQYHLPQHIEEHIDYITPGVKMIAAQRHAGLKRSLAVRNGASRGSAKIRPLASAAMANATDLSTCDEAISPACIRALYKIPFNHTFTPHPNNSLGIFEEGNYYSQADLDLFFAEYAPWIPQGTSPVPAFIDGAVAPVPTASGGPESDLDFDMAYPIVYPQTITLYQTDDLYWAANKSNLTGNGVFTGPYGGFNTFLDGIDGSYCTYSAYGETGDDPYLDPIYPDDFVPDGYKGQTMCGVYKPTPVISVSYSGQEDDVPEYYQKRQCNEYMKLGLQGTSILFASGDDGVGGIPYDDNVNGCLGPDATIFSPGFPNSCPYVTNVGATKVYPGHTVFEVESAANDPVTQPYGLSFSSGGGFSNVYDIPDYQAEAVASYFANHNPPYPYYTNTNSTGGIYNRTGRGYPDVSANGDNDIIIYDETYSLSGGTSASTPIFASILTLINEARLAANKSTVGFVNPVLYANPHVLNDVVNGSNPGCGTDGFSAVKGWDPVTGLGTPNYEKMVDLWMRLP